MAKRAATESESDYESDDAHQPVASTSTSQAPAKKAKAAVTDKSVEEINKMSETSLKACTKDQLVQIVLTLQAASQTSGAAAGSNGSSKVTPEQLEKQAQKFRDTIGKGIRKQIVWKPSCKTGGAKFSYEVIIPWPVMLKTLGYPEDMKMWKQRKISIDDIEEQCGPLSASVRYATLSVLNRNKDAEKNPECITLRYDEDSKLTVSGFYGK